MSQVSIIDCCFIFQIPEEEKNNILNELIASSRDSSSHVVDKEKFYKVRHKHLIR